MANRKAQPGKAYVAKAWRMYKANGGFLDKAYVLRYLKFFYGLQLSAEAAAAVLILFRSDHYAKDVYSEKVQLSDPF